MARPKGSRNVEPAKTPRYNPNHKKAQFANTEMANEAYAALRSAGSLRFHKVKEAYRTIYTGEYSCIAGFDVVWKRLLKKIAVVHGDDTYFKLNRQRELGARRAVRMEEKMKLRANKPYRRNLKNPPVV